MGSGLVLVAACSSIMSMAGFFSVLVALSGLTEDMKPLIWKQGMKEISEGHDCARAVMVVLFLALATALRKGLLWSRQDGTMAKATHIGAIGLTVVVSTLPLLTFSSAMREMHYALSFPVKGMHPAALKRGGEASFYVDERPAAIGLYGKRIHMQVSGKEYDGDCADETLLQGLAGGKECGAIIVASRGDPERRELPPALCLTAIEAKIACEVQGKRLGSPEEWDAAVGVLAPVQQAGGKAEEATVTRLAIGEWTMSMVHGNPVFEIKGADAAADIPRSLAPAEFSPRVGFRCAYRYER